MKLWTLLALFWLTTTVPASAQIAGKLKLGLDSDALSLASYDNGSGNANSELRVGIAPPNINGSVIGLPPFGLDVGYGVTNSLVLGAQMRFGYLNVDNGGGSSQSLYAFGLLPHVDFVILPRSAFRPYFGALAGVLVEDGDALVNRTLSFASFGAEIGAFGFVGRSFSIGPRLVFTFSQGLSNAVQDTKVFAVQLQLELSGWI